MKYVWVILVLFFFLFLLTEVPGTITPSPQLNMTVAQKLPRQVTVMWPHLWDNDPHQLYTLSPFLLHVLNHRIMWLLLNNKYNTRFCMSGYPPALITVITLQGLRSLEEIMAVFMLFVCLFVFYESKLSCFEVSCTFSLWALICKCWHNWSIMPVIYREIVAFVEKHHSRPGVGSECSKTLRKLLVP